MDTLRQLKIAMNAFATGSEEARDAAAEELSDLLEDASSIPLSDLQRVVAVLGGALAVEQSQDVVESILNALAKAKYHVHLPIEQVRDLRETLSGSALEHADYILED
nr:putative integron gene cassette protein [uncultured bacterium]